MSMELETGLHGVTRPKPDLESEQDPERLKSGHEPKLSESDLSDETDSDYEDHGVDEDQFSSDSDSQVPPNISPYDDIPSPPAFVPIPYRLCGSRSIFPLEINKETDKHYRLRPLLTQYSQTALNHYNEGSGASFEYVGLVKCNCFRDVCRSASIYADPDPDRRPDEYYITFEAKAKGDPSTTIFQATILVDVLRENKPHYVKECRIQI